VTEEAELYLNGRFEVSGFSFQVRRRNGQRIKKRYSEEETAGRNYAAAIESCNFNGAKRET
jgi:hypothetical protein